MIKVYQPPRLINSMGTTTIPALDFESGENWDTEEGRLLIMDASGEAIAEFAQGHWSHVILVD